MQSVEELEQLLGKHGWHLSLQKRRSRGKRYAYAKRRVIGGPTKTNSRYLAAESKLTALTAETVLRRIHKQADFSTVHEDGNDERTANKRRVLGVETTNGKNLH